VSSTATKKVDGLNLRFIQVMEALGHTGYSLSRKLETSEAVISNIRLGKNPPNIQLVRDLLKEYEEVDPGWLLTGKGRMLAQPVPQVESAAPVTDLTQRMDARFDELEKLLKRALSTQVERNTLVDESISELEKQLDALTRERGTIRKDRRKEG
jgi:predicted transcriptional regulator